MGRPVRRSGKFFAEHGICYEDAAEAARLREQTERERHRDAIVAALRCAGRPMTSQEIREKTGIGIMQIAFVADAYPRTFRVEVRARRWKRTKVTYREIALRDLAEEHRAQVRDAARCRALAQRALDAARRKMIPGW